MREGGGGRQNPCWAAGRPRPGPCAHCTAGSNRGQTPEAFGTGHPENWAPREKRIWRALLALQTTVAMLQASSKPWLQQMPRTRLAPAAHVSRFIAFKLRTRTAQARTRAAIGITGAAAAPPDERPTPRGAGGAPPPCCANPLSGEPAAARPPLRPDSSADDYECRWSECRAARSAPRPACTPLRRAHLEPADIHGDGEGRAARARGRHVPREGRAAY